MVCAQQGLDFHVDFSPAAGEKLRDARAEGSLSVQMNHVQTKLIVEKN